MPIVPQYRAEGPAQPLAPELESIQGPRVDASTALRGLAQLQGAAQGVAQPLPNASEDLGQGAMRGLSAIGQGVQNVGQVVFDVEQRIAEAWNFRKLSEAQDVMDREVADFESWKLNEQNPNKWTTEWNSRFERVKGQILSGDDLSPAAKDAINQRVITFGTRHGYGVQLDAQKQIIGLAADSSRAEAMRAIQAGDAPGAAMILDNAFQQGWMTEYEVERMKWQASETIKEDNLNAAKMRSATFAMRGAVQDGRAELANAEWDTPEEKEFALATYDTETAVRATVSEIGNRIANGEDPDAIRAELEAKDENGNFTAYPDLPASSRAEVLKPIYAASNAEYESVIEGASKFIESGVIQDENSLNSYFAGKEIDPLNKAILTAKLRGEVIKTEKAIVDLQAAAASYDPSKDPDGRAYSAQMSATLLTLGDDPRSEEILGTLTKRRNGEPLTLSEDIFRVKAKEVSDLRDAAADYKVPATNLVVEEKDGRQVFVDYSETPDPGDPARFEKTVDPWWGKPTVTAGRVVDVSQDDRETLLKAFTPDRNAFDAGKVEGIYVTDLKKKAAADSETATVLNEMKRRADTGVVKEDNWEEQYTGVVMPIKDKAAATIIDSSGLFAQPMEQRRIDTLRAKAEMLRASKQQ